MATPDELRRLERAAAAAADAFSRAHAENLAADAAWTKMLDAAQRSCANGQSVSAEFIIAAGARARAGQGIVKPKPEKPEPRKIVPLHEWRSDIHGTDAIIPRSRRW